MSEKRFRWDYQQQPPMAEIAETVANMTDGIVRLTMVDDGSDEYELVITVAAPILKDARRVLGDPPLRDWMGVQIGNGNNQVNTFGRDL